jgi:proline iminopeptidase
MSKVLVRMNNKMSAQLRARIQKPEAAGLFGHGKPYEQNRCLSEYMIAALGKGYFPYLYHNDPDELRSRRAASIARELRRKLWGEHGEFVIDLNWKSVEATDRLPTIKLPMLIIVGERDECMRPCRKPSRKRFPALDWRSCPTAGTWRSWISPDCTSKLSMSSSRKNLNHTQETR